MIYTLKIICCLLYTSPCYTDDVVEFLLPIWSYIILSVIKLYIIQHTCIFTERNGHKRSRSEDNILQANDSEADTSNEDIIITPQLIGQVS